MRGSDAEGEVGQLLKGRGLHDGEHRQLLLLLSRSGGGGVSVEPVMSSWVT